MMLIIMSKKWKTNFVLDIDLKGLKYGEETQSRCVSGVQ